MAARGWRAVAIAVGVAAVVSASAATLPRILAQTPASSAAGPAAAAAHRARGLQLGYNLDHADALLAFKAAIAADPTHPAAYRLAAATVWADLLFEQGSITVDDYLGQARDNLPRATPNVALVAAFQGFLQQAIALSDQRLREHPTDADAHYQVGAALGLQASYTATIEGRVMGSFGAARRAYKEQERALQLDPARKDAGLMVGLYSDVVSELSAPMRLFAHLLGLGGDRVRGLRLVEDAARYPGDSQTDALLTLILMYTRQSRYDDARRIVTELQGMYPRNRLLWLEAGNAALRAGRPADAKAALEQGLAYLGRDTRPRAFGEDSRWRYAYGAALVGVKDIAHAEQELQAALSGAMRDWIRGRIHNELGKLHDLRSDRLHALEEYRLADRLCRQEHDADCSAEARNLIKTPYR